MKYLLLTILFISFVAFAHFEKLPDVCPNIITRRGWAARPSTYVDYLITPVKYAIIEHTGTSTCDNEEECIDIVFSIQSHQVNVNKWDDIGYNFLIGGDGNVYEGIGWDLVGAHAYGYNRKSIGIAFIGNFEDNTPTQASLDAAKNLLECGQQLNKLESLYILMGHRDVIATLSPGKIFIKSFENGQDSQGFQHLNK